MAGGRAVVRCTTRADGDLHAERVPPAELAARRAALAGGPSTWLREVHGAEVVVVAEPGGLDGATADAAVTATPATPLGIWVGDCAPVALVGSQGVVGAAHAGWRGLLAGVLGRAVGAMRSLGAGDVVAVLGPCIGPECYEFGAADLAAVAGRLGDEVRSTTAWGSPALDVRAAVRADLARHGVELADTDATCTACAPGELWSHRARGDLGRQGLLVWIEAA